MSEMDKDNRKQWEQDFYGDNVSVTSRDHDFASYCIRDKSGEALLTRYQVFSGIAIVYNDVHMPYIEIKGTNHYSRVMEINHCREGRIEFESSGGEYLYVKKGDMAINTKAGVKEYSNFPLSHYHGLTIEIDLEAIKKHPEQLLIDMKIDVESMYQLFCKNNRPLVLHEKKEFEHLFAELYTVPDKIRRAYYKLKIAEILLYLSAIDMQHEKKEKRYFNKDLVVRVKEAHEYMVTNYAEKITIEYLSEKFHISQTRLKNCFKEIYGNSVYAYLKEFRIKKATELLRESNLDIGKIACEVGYDNASKFAESFKSIMGMNPSEYRRNLKVNENSLNGAL